MCGKVGIVSGRVCGVSGRMCVGVSGEALWVSDTVVPRQGAR